MWFRLAWFCCVAVLLTRNRLFSVCRQRLASFQFPFGLVRIPLAAVAESLSFRDFIAVNTDAPTVTALVSRLLLAGWQEHQPMRAVLTAATGADAVPDDISDVQALARLSAGTVRVGHTSNRLWLPRLLHVCRVAWCVSNAGQAPANVRHVFAQAVVKPMDGVHRSDLCLNRPELSHIKEVPAFLYRPGLLQEPELMVRVIEALNAGPVRGYVGRFTGRSRR